MERPNFQNERKLYEEQKKQIDKLTKEVSYFKHQTEYFKHKGEIRVKSKETTMQKEVDLWKDKAESMEKALKLTLSEQEQKKSFKNVRSCREKKPAKKSVAWA